MPIHYENLTPAQAGDFKRLRRIAIQTDPRAFGTALDEIERESLATIADAMAYTLENGGRYLMAYDDGEPVAMATLIRHRADRRKRHHVADVVNVYVVASHRGRGLARGMLTRLIAFAQTQPGLRVLQLTVVTDSEAARRLYESLGFVVWGAEPCAMWDDEDGCVDMYHMALQLWV